MPEIQPIESSSSKPADGVAIASEPRLVQPRSTPKTHRSTPTLIQLIALGFQVALFFTAISSIGYGLLLYLPPSLFSSTFHPAQIPWLTTPDTCEQTGRTWQQGRCLDYDHDPRF
jgi:hypothetical protein